MFFGTRKYPKGPNLDKNEPISLDLSGTEISLSLPISNKRLPKSYQVKGVTSVNKGGGRITLDIDQFEPKLKSSRFSGQELFNRSYDFNGIPVLDGSVGGIFITATGTFDKEGNVCSNFYELVHDQLDRLYALDKDEPYFKWLYPIDWQLLDISGINTLFYSVQDLTASRRGSVRTISNFVLPVSNSFKLQISAEMEVAKNSGCLPLATNLIKTLMDSVIIHYSDRHFSEVQSAKLKEKFKEVKPFIWHNYLEARSVEYSILDQYR